MSSVIKIKPSGTAFVESSHATKNFSSLKKLYTGSLHTSPSNTVMFKTLVKFDPGMLYELPVESAYLCFYVKEINNESSFYSNNNFCIYKNEELFNIDTVTWNTTPRTSCAFPFLIDNDSIKHYAKINITTYVSDWICNGNNFGITIEPQNYYSSLVKFASVNSDNSPWLLIKYKAPSAVVNGKGRLCKSSL